MNSPTLDAVLTLARAVPVFPCRPVPSGKYKAKAPFTEHGFKEASRDPNQITVWYHEFPGCLWGVPTGRATKLVVLDYDPDKATQATQEWIEGHTDLLMLARAHTTGRNGRHYLYRASNGAIYSCGSDITLDKKKRPGLDIRGEGGYIIWWPLQGLAAQGEAPELPDGFLTERAFHAQNNRPALPSSPERWARDQPLVAAALAYLDPEGYDAWIQNGMAIHYASAGGEAGFMLWHAWSAGEVNGTAPKTYGGLEICRDKWESFGKSNGNGRPRTLGSLFTEAKAAGWPGPERQEQEGPTPHTDADIPGNQQVESPADHAPVLHFTDTDMANAARLVRRHGENIRYASEGKWLIWEGKRWIIDDKAVRIQGLAKDTAQSIYDEIKTAPEPKAMFTHARKSQSKGALEAMAVVARDAVLCSLSDFDADPWLLNARNGTIDLRSGMMREHRRTDQLTKIVEIDYDRNADCELWDQFLQYITALDDDLYGYLRRLIGYALTGDTTEQVLHFLFGIGANGKSVFCEVLAELLGDYAIIVSPELIMQKRHQGIPNDIARLRGIRLAMMNETSQGAHFDEQKLKDLTGSDKLNARFLHAEFFDFNPTHKLIIRGNHKPVISGTDEGIWRRLRLVPFAVNIPSDEQDKLLINKLRAELPGILNWAVQGCLEWQRDGLKPPAVIMDAVKEYRQESDTLGRFIAECCTTRKNAQVKSSAFFKRYQEFADASGERWMPSKDLPHEMKRRGFGWRRMTAGMIFEGIELQNTETEHQDWRDR